MNVSIVIPNWNGRELLGEYFPSVVSAAENYHVHTNTAVEILLIDDASTDESLNWLNGNYANDEFVRVLKNEENLGFLRTVNKGFAAANGDVVFLLNNDVEVEADCVAPLVRHFADPNIFAVCCRAARINSERLDGGGKIGRFERGFWRVFLNYEAIPDEADSALISFYGSGGYTMYGRAKWLELGGFQDCLAPIYWEDVEICYRAWKRGWKVLYEPGSHVRHLGSATMGKKPMRAEMTIVTERNRLLMTWINLHDRKMFAGHLLWLFLKLLGSAVSLNWNYLRSFSRAIGKLDRIWARRGIEKKATIMTDRQLKDRFLEIVKQPGIHVVATEADEIAFLSEREKGALQNTDLINN